MGALQTSAASGRSLGLTKLSTTAPKSGITCLTKNKLEKFPLLKASPGLQYSTSIRSDAPPPTHTAAFKPTSALTQGQTKVIDHFGSRDPFGKSTKAKDSHPINSYAMLHSSRGRGSPDTPSAAQSGPEE